MLSLHQLRCFLTVYELGSLTAAAEELGYAQPSISEQIRALEKSLGHRAVPPRRSRRRTHDRRRHPAPACRGHHRRGRGGPAGGAAGQGVRDRDDPVRDVRKRAALRQRDAGQRRPRALPRCARRDHRPELLRGARRPASWADRGGPDRGTTDQRGPPGDTGGPRRAGLRVDGPATYGEPGHRPPAGGSTTGDGRHQLPGDRLHAAGVAQDAARGRPQPADPDRGRGRRDRRRADRSRSRRHRRAPGRGPGAGAAARPRRHVDRRCARDSTRPSPSCTGSTRPSPPPPG